MNYKFLVAVAAGALCLPAVGWCSDAVVQLKLEDKQKSVQVEATTWEGEVALRIPMAFRQTEWKKAGFPMSRKSNLVETGWLYLTPRMYQLQSNEGYPLMTGLASQVDLDRSRCVEMHSLGSTVCGYLAIPNWWGGPPAELNSPGEFSEVHEFLRMVDKNFMNAYALVVASGEASSAGRGQLMQPAAAPVREPATFERTAEPLPACAVERKPPPAMSRVVVRAATHPVFPSLLEANSEQDAQPGAVHTAYALVVDKTY